MKAEKLYPVCKNYIWGGEKLIKKYGKDENTVPCAESWELSFHPDGLCRLSDGRTLCDAVSAEELGENCRDFPYFPMLIKLIDAKEDLSVQVHPSDGYAASHGLGYGKTEMWYVVEAEPGACLYVGFNKKVTDGEIRAAIADETLPSLLKKIKVKPGDAYFIPAGTVHAIGRGCLICEIQQNSNITYRLYDYGRKDKNGKQRELHIEDALRVLDKTPARVSRQNVSTRDGELIFASKPFSAYSLEINTKYKLKADKGTFRCVTCVKGGGYLDGKKINAGDSYFIPAGTDEYALSGKMTLIVSSVRRYAVGLDLGGTFIKGGVADDLGNIIVSDKTETRAENGADEVSKRMASLCRSLLKKAGLTSDDICGTGVGAPGMIDSENGEVVYSNNLKWSHFPIKNSLEKRTGSKVRIGNDANVAALGEAVFGAGAGCKNTVMITLGTGVGGGIVLNGRLYEGNRSAGAELGHLCIVKDGETCTCGRRGCLEAYASATALIRDTKRAIASHPDSLMANEENIDGRTAFLYKDKDKYASRLVSNYIEYLACGITDIANVFRPEKVLVGGGMSAEGEGLMKPLREYVNRNIFGGDMGPAVEITQAALGNKAGILGAAALALEKEEKN